MAEAERAENEIVAKLGHSSPQMAAHYSGRASQKKRALSAAEKLQRAKRLA